MVRPTLRDYHCQRVDPPRSTASAAFESGRPARCNTSPTASRAGARDLLAGAHDDPARRPAHARPQRKDHDFPARPAICTEHRVDAVGAVDKGDRAFGFAMVSAKRTQSPSSASPSIVASALPGFADVVGALAVEIGRVGDHMVEGAGADPRRRVQQIADHHRGARRHAVEDDVVAGDAHQIALASRARSRGIAAPAPRGTASPRRCRSRYRAPAVRLGRTAAARNTGSIAARAPSAG